MQDIASASFSRREIPRVRATTIVQVQAIQVSSLQLPPFRAPFCIAVHPTIVILLTLEILIRTDFSAFAWRFNLREPIVAKPLRWKQWITRLSTFKK
jgi:hypothetical protein